MQCVTEKIIHVVLFPGESSYVELAQNVEIDFVSHKTEFLKEAHPDVRRQTGHLHLERLRDHSLKTTVS